MIEAGVLVDPLGTFCNIVSCVFSNSLAGDVIQRDKAVLSCGGLRLHTFKIGRLPPRTAQCCRVRVVEAA